MSAATWPSTASSTAELVATDWAVKDSRGRAVAVVSEWMCVSISCRSKSTRESGVARSRLGSERSFVEVMSVLANEWGENAGSRKAS